MNKQEILDKVANHLMKQKAKAKSNWGSSCKYLADDGKKCAVGCLIPKRLYNPGIEGERASSEKLHPIYKALGINLRNVNFLIELQLIHDDSEVDKWKDELRAVAKNNHLKIPACLK